MSKPRHAFCFAIGLSVWAVLLVGTAHARPDNMSQRQLIAQLTQTIAKVREMRGPSMARTNESENLSQLTQKINPKQVDDKTLMELGALVEPCDDPRRYSVGTSICDLGRRSKAAAPT